MARKTIPLRNDDGRLAGSVSIASPDLPPQTPPPAPPTASDPEKETLRTAVNDRVAQAREHLSANVTEPKDFDFRERERCNKCGRFVRRGTAGHADGDCSLHHPGTRTAVALARTKHPDLDAAVIERVAVQLNNEAEMCGMHEDVAHPDQVEAMLNKMQIELDYAQMDDPTYRAFCQKRLDELRAEYEAHPDSITEADLHVWKYLHRAAGHEDGRKHRSTPLTIGIDVDGVLYDCHAVMNDHMAAQGYTEPEDIQSTYSLAKFWGVTPDVIGKEFRTAVRNGTMFRFGESLQDGKAAVKRLYAENHRIVLITARDYADDPELTKIARKATVRWARDENIPFDELHLTGEKEKINVDVLLDDAPQNIDRVVGHGMEGVIIDRSFNRLEGHGHARRSWVDVVRELSQPEPDSVLFEIEPELSSAARDREIPLGQGSTAGPATTA